MTEEQTRLYVLARIAAAPIDRIRTIAEPAAGGTLYTIELTRHGEKRWFGVHSLTLVAVPDGLVVDELRRSFARPRPAEARAAE